MSRNTSLHLFALAGLAALLPACSSPNTIDFVPIEPTASNESVATNLAALTQDGLTLAFSRFRTEFVALGRDHAFDVGLAPFTVLGTENIGRAGVVLNMDFNGTTPTGTFSAINPLLWRSPRGLPGGPSRPGTLMAACSSGSELGKVAMNGWSIVKLFSARWQLPHVRPLPAKVSEKKT